MIMQSWVLVFRGYMRALFTRLGQFPHSQLLSQVPFFIILTKVMGKYGPYIIAFLRRLDISTFTRSYAVDFRGIYKFRSRFVCNLN